MAMGADRGIHVSTDLRTDQDLQPLAVARILKALAEVCIEIFIIPIEKFLTR